MKKTNPHIPVLRPSLPSAKKIQPWLEEIDQNLQYTNFGPLCMRLGRELARMKHATYAVCVSSGTLGLELALQALELDPGANVLLPSMTFPATATAILRCGLTPLFGDIDAASLGLTPDVARAALSEQKVSAVVPVALHGHHQDASRWDSFSAETGVPVLMDAAGAIGDQDIGRTTSAVFSLHATKPLGVGEGGVVVTNSENLADRVRRLSNFGFEGGQLRSTGSNGKLSEYHAAVGLAALVDWRERKERRQRIFEKYRATLRRPELQERLELITRSSLSPNLSIRLSGPVGQDLINGLAEDGVETRRWYWPPLHRHPALSHLPRADDLVVTSQVSDNILGLPFHEFLTGQDIDRIGDALVRCLK